MRIWRELWQGHIVTLWQGHIVTLSHCDRVTCEGRRICWEPSGRCSLPWTRAPRSEERRTLGFDLEIEVVMKQRWVRVWDFSTCSTSSECVVGPVIHLVEPVRRVWKFPLKDPSFQGIAKHRLSDRYLIVRETDRIVGIPQIEVEGNTPHYDQP